MTVAVIFELTPAPGRKQEYLDLAAALCTLAFATGAAFAGTDQDTHSRYDSHSTEGDSAIWGVGA